MTGIRWILFCLLIFLGASAGGCDSPEKQDFEIYLVAGDVPTNQFMAADLDDLELMDQALISTIDFISYDKSNHTIELEPNAYQRVRDLFTLPVDVDGMPFVVSVGREPIYRGAFWTPASSLIFEGVTIMEPFTDDSTVIRLEWGYPTEDFVSGADPRSDSRIIETLEAAGKLK